MEKATLPVTLGFGIAPTLTEPNATFLPIVTIAEAVGWSAGMKPVCRIDGE
jgi:hypothetical protein